MTAPLVLLVAANPAQCGPPVPPYGLELVAQAFRDSGCAVELILPFIEADPVAALDAALDRSPALVGLGVRNLDDALVVRRAEGLGPIDVGSFLPELLPLARRAVQRMGPARVLLGGGGVGAAPEEMLGATGAGVAFVGPSDDLCAQVGASLVKGDLVWPEDPRVLHAGARWPGTRGFAGAWVPPRALEERHEPALALALARGGRVPVMVAQGCDRRCWFCVEGALAGRKVHPRPVDAIRREVEALVARGIERVFLATSELNVPDERHAISVLEALADLDVELRAFLQPAPVTHELLDAMETAGLDPEQVSIELGHLDDGLLRRGAGPANLPQIMALVGLWLERGYRSLNASILLGAHPDETLETIDGALATALRIDDALPDGLTLAYATGARVYPASPLAGWIRAHRQEAEPHLYGAADASFLEPVVFCCPLPPRALLDHVQACLLAMKGQSGPMNSDAPEDKSRKEALRLLDRGFVRLAEGRLDEGAGLLAQAVDLDPSLREGEVASLLDVLPQGAL